MFRWLISPIKNQLFEGVVEYLMKEERFIKQKKNLLRKEVCNLVAIRILRKKSLKGDVFTIYYENLFKYLKFRDILSLVKKTVTPLVNKKSNELNLTTSEISLICKDKENEKLKSEMQAITLSYLYLMLTIKSPNIGAGDVATFEFQTGLSKYSAFYKKKVTTW